MTNDVPTRYSGPVDVTRRRPSHGMGIAELVIPIGFITAFIFMIYAAVDFSIAPNQKP